MKEMFLKMLYMDFKNFCPKINLPFNFKIYELFKELSFSLL